MYNLPVTLHTVTQVHALNTSDMLRFKIDLLDKCNVAQSRSYLVKLLCK